jgi:hypothetical protein
MRSRVNIYHSYRQPCPASAYTRRQLMVSALLTSQKVETQAANNQVRPGQLTVKLVAASLVWVALLIAGAVVMLTHANAPGPSGALPANWPQSSPVSRDANKPTLVMFVHPQCPCAKTSVGELARLMMNCRDRFVAQVFFIQPAGESLDWVHTDVWRDASQIPGVTVQVDEAGRQARLFGAETSGETALYDAHGRLLFHGGITISRGHAGENPGSDAIQALLLGNPPPLTNAPTFGCSLFECSMKKTSP